MTARNATIRWRMIGNATLGLTLIVCAVGLASAAPGEFARKIQYHGVLTEPGTGNPVQGAHDITVSIFDAETGGANLWSETHEGVNLKKGVFNVMLGRLNTLPSDIFDNAPLYLEIQVDDDNPMTPRQELASVPFAHRVAKADRATKPDQSTCAEGEHLRKVGGDWVCTDRVNKADRATKPDQSTCDAGQHLRKVGSDWECTDRVSKADRATKPDQSTCAGTPLQFIVRLYHEVPA